MDDVILILSSRGFSSGVRRKLTEKREMRELKGSL
jgi:hypothetical protein